VVERRRVLLVLFGVSVLLLLAEAAAPNLPALIAAQFAVGLTGMSAQLLIPFAVDLTPIEDRGRTVGGLMAGLLAGVLIGRVAAGFLSDAYGWRAVFLVAAAVMVGMTVVLYFTLPHRPPTARLTYVRLMRSLVGLLRTQRRMWGSAIVSALSFAAYTALWTTLAFLMASRFHRGATETGLFSLVGMAGALMAPLAGKLSDRRGAALMLTLAVAVSLLAFTVMVAWVTIAGLIVGMTLLDLGTQSVQVAAQSHVMHIQPDARSRLNTIYMVLRFIGGASGSVLGAAAWTHAGWTGVCGTAILLLAVAMLVHCVAKNDQGSLKHR
jgi:predicted MFS family arabinose efflux permease